MIQLLCNGVFLDLKEGQTLQFKHDNPLFAFDSLSCERTTEFALPCTPKNDAVLSLARIPAYDGAGMRQRFTAQMQSGAVVKDGYLYVSQYTGSEYKAIFVTGELVGLQQIRDLGKIGDFMTYSDIVKLGENEQQPAVKRTNGDRWANCYTAHPTARPTRPSINLPKIYNDVITAQNITAAALPTEAAHLWLISEAKGIDEAMQFKNEVTDTTQPVGISAADPANPQNTITENTTAFEYEDTIYEVQVLSTDGRNNQKYNVRQFKAKTDVNIECPDDWPSTRYVIDLSFTHEDDDGGTAFYGGRWFDSDSSQDPQTHIIPHGEELKGRTFLVRAGECFSIVDTGFFLDRRTPYIGGTYAYDYGFMLNQTDGGEYEFDFDLQLNVKSADDGLTFGQVRRLQDNLPDITFTDLLKVFAVVSGRVLNYDSTNGITFDALNFATWGTFDLTGRVTKYGELLRTFSDYAQRNILEYNSGEDVTERITNDYTITNANIEEEKTLATIPFSEGAQDARFPSWIYVYDDTTGQILGTDIGAPAVIERVQLPKNSGLQTLCTASTQIKITARLTLAEYMSITAKTKILLDGTLYVWTASTWKDDNAEITLAKI